KNFAPRIGVAWDITGNGRTSLRAGYGMTYERLFYALSPFFQASSTFAIASLTAGTPALPPGTVIPVTPLTPTNLGPFGVAGAVPFPQTFVRGIQQDIDAPRVHFWNVSLEREIAQNTVFALQYAGSAGRDLFTLSNVNRP